MGIILLKHLKTTLIRAQCLIQGADNIGCRVRPLSQLTNTLDEQTNEIFFIFIFFAELNLVLKSFFDQFEVFH